MTVTTRPASLDLLAPVFRVNSDEVRAAARRHWYAESALGPVVLTYDDCTALLHDRRIRQAGAGHLADQGISDGPVAEMWTSLILNVDDPDHARLRRLVAPAFTPAAAERLRGRMREIVHTLIDSFAPAGRCDFVAAFADHYPPRVIFDLLGVPTADQEDFLGWGKDLAWLLSYEMPAHHERVAAAIAGLTATIGRLSASRRAEPGDDLLSALIAACDGSDRLSAEEIRSMVMVLVLAGQDSTRCQLGLALDTLARFPEQWARLGEWPELAPAAVEEIMRVNPVVPIIWRVADVDLDHKDLHLRAGTRLWLMVGHAQLDGPDGADDPFDITAEHRPQLTFGHGTHYCLGDHLSRAEMAEALAILARRLPDLELDGPGDYRPDIAGFTGPERLPIRFTPTSI